MGAGGGYLANGGFSELFPETSAALNSATGGLVGSGAGTSGAVSYDQLGKVNEASNGFGFSGSSGLEGLGKVAGGQPASSFSTALAGLSGGGGSSYSPVGLGASLLGGINSMNANDKAEKDLLASQNSALERLNPYLASGAAANSRLSDLLGTSGNSSASGYGSLDKPFTAEDLQNDPGYQFQLQQGNQALDRQQSAKGGYFSGAALKAAQEYGTGLADQTYKDAYARDAANKQQTYGMFSGQSGQGLATAGTAGGIDQNMGATKANAGIANSGVVNSTLSALLSGSGAKRLVGYTASGQPLYA